MTGVGLTELLTIIPMLGVPYYEQFYIIFYSCSSLKKY